MDLAITHAEPMHNHDGSAMLDDCGQIVYRSQYLATHPLRRDCKERMTPGGMLLTYMTGEGVIRTMNSAFGHDGWSTEILKERQVTPDGKKWTVGYMATVKVSISNKNSHQDVGVGEACHESKLKALDTAVKSAITDAMKRAARHFGERLGNALYVAGNGIHSAPKDNKTALKQLKEQEAMDLFGTQSLNRELRASARMAETQTKIEQHEKIPSSSPHESFQSTLPLEMKVTPPLVNVRASSHSPQQYFGFTKASEFGAMVTPQHPTGLHHAGHHSNLHLEDSRAFLPDVALPEITSTTSFPPTHRCNQMPGDNQPTNPPSAEATATKRQKVAQNPYQR